MKLLITLFCMLSCSSSILGEEPYIIMSIGDSITSGGHGNPSGFYRQTTQERLTEVGIGFDFVGDFRSGNPDVFDNEHQGITGAWLGATFRTLPSPLEAHDPDFALVLLGTNVHNNPPDDDFASNYRELLQFITDRTSDVSIIIATVPGFSDDFGPNGFTQEDIDFRNEQVFPAINAGIRTAAAEFDNTVVVDYSAIIDLETDISFDGVHPNLFGQQKLGNLFADELVAQIGVAVPVPEPSGFVVLTLMAFAIVSLRRRPPIMIYSV